MGQFLTLDVATLSLMANGLMQTICNKNADIICQQIQRASEVQDVLRARQLKDYQAQINKTAEQAVKVRKAGIISAVCDWIVSGIQLVMGTLRVMAGDVVGAWLPS
ncbi:Secreted effector protein SseC [Sodalis praecaptivus]